MFTSGETPISAVFGLKNIKRPRHWFATPSCSAVKSWIQCRCSAWFFRASNQSFLVSFLGFSRYQERLFQLSKRGFSRNFNASQVTEQHRHFVPQWWQSAFQGLAKESMALLFFGFQQKVYSPRSFFQDKKCAVFQRGAPKVQPPVSSFSLRPSTKMVTTVAGLMMIMLSAASPCLMMVS